MKQNLANFGGDSANFGEFWRKLGKFGTLASEFGLLWWILAWAFESFQPKFAKCAHFSVSQKGSNFEHLIWILHIFVVWWAFCFAYATKPGHQENEGVRSQTRRWGFSAVPKCSRSQSGRTQKSTNERKRAQTQVRKRAQQGAKRAQTSASTLKIANHQVWNINVWELPSFGGLELSVTILTETIAS